jgi:hypothetical protein
MLRKLLQRTVEQAIEKHYRDLAPASDGRQTVPVYGQSALTVYQISNGWLISSQTGSLTYVQEAKDLGDHILTNVTRDRMGIADTVRMNVHSSGSSGLANAIPYRS